MGRALAISYGAGSRSVYGGEGTTSYAPRGSTPAGPGLDWVGDTACKATTKKGEPCTAHRVEEHEFCVGHLKQQESEIAGE